MGKRVFDPPLAYAEIDRVYSFTTHVLRALGMPQWRLQVMTKPCRHTSYADITPGEMKHVGELRLAPAWMTMDVEAERIPTLIQVTVSEAGEASRLAAWVDQEKPYTQPVWDHALECYGPREP